MGVCQFLLGNRKHLVVLFNIFTLLYCCVFTAYNISERKGISFCLSCLKAGARRNLGQSIYPEFGGVHLPTGSQGQRGSAHGCNRSGKRGSEKGAPKKLFLSHSANRSRPQMLQPVPAECIPSVGSINNWGSPGYSRTLTTHWHILQPADWGRQTPGTDVASLHSFSSCFLVALLRYQWRAQTGQQTKLKS